MKTGKMILGILLSILALVVAQVLAQLLASVLLLVHISAFIGNVAAGILYILFAYFLLKLICRKILKGDMSDYNIPKFYLKLKWVIVAFLMPIAVIAVYILFVPGTFVENSLDAVLKLEILSYGIFFTGFGAGIVEEMVFRGVLMSAVEKRFGKKVAIIVPSVLFGFVHILGMDFNLLSCALVLVAGTMVGIMFSLIAMETKSVWNSAIVHAVWNMMIIGGTLCIGTAPDEYSLYSYVLDSDVFLLTGGEFGIESSAVAVAGYTVVCVIVWLRSGKKTA